jgi:hypothetical protein
VIAKPYPNEHLRYTHTVYEYADYLKIANLGAGAQARYLLERLAKRLNVLGLVSLLPLLAVPLLWAKDPLIRYLSVIGLIQAAGLLTETWLSPHFLAGVVALVFAVLGRPGAALGLSAAVLLVPALWASVPGFHVYHESRTSEYGTPRKRERIEETLARLPGKHLLFVRYNLTNDIRDWVHNRPDLKTAAVVWARDLGPARDRELWKASFPDRRCWLVNAEVPVAELSSCGGEIPTARPAAAP